MLNILITVSVFAITAYWWTVGVYAGRVLKGAKPVELPVVQASSSSSSSIIRPPGCSALLCRRRFSPAPTR